MFLDSSRTLPDTKEGLGNPDMSGILLAQLAKDLRSEIIHTLSVTHSLSDETGPCAQSTLFDIAKPDELLEGGLDAYVLLRALERQIDRKVGVHKYEQLLDALAHLVV